MKFIKQLECKICQLPNFESILAKFCPNQIDFKIDFSENVKTKDWQKEIVKTTKSEYKIDVLTSKIMNMYDFLIDFHQFLTKKSGFIWHYHSYNIQRFHYNEMLRNLKLGKPK